MPYHETRPPTSSEREAIYHYFYDLTELCYPDCRYIDESDSSDVYVYFFSEVEIEEEEEGQDKERAAAVVGGEGAEIDDLRLLIDIETWRAQSSESNTILLIHEVTHVKHAEHGDGFWKNFVRNVQTVLDEGPETVMPGCSGRELLTALVHHPSPHSCDGDWTMYDRQEWLIDRFPYPQVDFETFEKLVHPTSNNAEFGEFRQLYDAATGADTDAKPKISFFPIRDGKMSNAKIYPELIESPPISELKVRVYLDDLRERGYPPIPVPVVELTPSGQYRITDGELAVAVAQRIGFPEIGVVNTDLDYETVEEHRPDDQRSGPRMSTSQIGDIDQVGPDAHDPQGN